jgi:hypothetical protein
MRWQTKVKPPNRDHYLNRCAALKKSLNSAEYMPPFLICANCWFVLKKALGNDWLVLRWMVLNMIHDRWQGWQERAFWTWHKYIRCRSIDEIVEVIDQQLERETGEDHREWPNVIAEEESK